MENGFLKEEGGLWVIDLKKHYKALMLKTFTCSSIRRHSLGKSDLGKLYSNGNLPNHVKKGSFLWRENLKNLDTFKVISLVQLRNGKVAYSR
jgi:hypothetical protein